MKNKTLKAFFEYKAVVLVFLIVGFLIGYFVTQYLVNENISFYEIELKSNQHPSTFLNESYFEKILAEIDEHNANLSPSESKISYAKIEYADMLKHTKIHNLPNAGEYLIRIQRKYFPTTIKSSSGEINDGASRCAKYMELILTYNTEDTVEVEFLNLPIVREVGYYNPYLMGLATAFGMLFISFAFFFIITHGKAKKILVDISDNELIFKTPFHAKYWRFAKRELSGIKNLCVISILFALMFICKAFTLPSGFGALGIGLTYLVFSVIAMIYGPFCGLAIGMLSDILGYFVFQSGTVFFPGYTLNAMLSGFMYGLCFYKTKITFAKCLYARIFVNLIVNVFLGSVWWAIINGLNMDAFWSYVIVIALPKNLVYLLPQSILLYIVLKAVCRPIAAFGLIDERIGENVSII